MKKFLTFAWIIPALTTILFAFSACDSDEPSAADTKQFSVKIVGSERVPMTGGTVTIAITMGTKTKSWKATPQKDWVTLSATSGTEDATITATVKAGFKDYCDITFEHFTTDEVAAKYIRILRGETTDPEEDPGVVAECKYQPQPISVSDSKKVIFSKGNLQYQGTYNGSIGTFRFAEHQYDYVGYSQSETMYWGNVYINTVERCDNKNVDSKYRGWIDLFGWGTSGYHQCYPYLHSTDDAAYGPSTGNINGTNFDWGVENAIESSYANQWRTLTQDEWNFVLFQRPNARDRSAYAKLHKTEGFVLFPDDWTAPTGISIVYCSNTSSSVLSNVWTLEQWAELEALGAVFLPAAGSRTGTLVNNSNYIGYYWTTTADGSVTMNASAVMMRVENSSSLSASVTMSSFRKHLGLSVRLVRNRN